MRSRLLALAAIVGACGGVHDIALPSAPFATVRAHVDLAKALERASGRPLVAAIVWGRVPNVPAICYEFSSDPVVAANCADPFGFFPGSIDVTTPVDATGDGSITFTLDHLPSADVLIGTDVDHVAYASIFLVADTNSNGAINLQSQNQGNKGRGGRPGSGNTTPTPPDEIVAASFVTLHGEQQRLSFREGAFDELKLFYPIPACDTPSTGFTVIRSGPYGDATATCETATLDTPIETAVLDATTSFALACRSNGNNGGGGNRNGGSRVTEAGAPDTGADVGDRPQHQVPDTTNAHCLNSSLFVIPNAASTTGTATCLGLSTYALVGCSNDPNCDTAEWDHRDTPPDWWPCAP